MMVSLNKKKKTEGKRKKKCESASQEPNVHPVMTTGLNLIPAEKSKSFKFSFVFIVVKSAQVYLLSPFFL